MDLNSDSSMLSDELKPRRTPVPSSFGDTVPRPSVPDLSIIETPQTSAQRQSTGPVAQPQSSLNHLSYNDWRLKTGVGPFYGTSCDRNRNGNSEATQTGHNSPSAQATASMSKNGYRQENFDHRKERTKDFTYSRPSQPSGKVVSYMDLKHRPTSAPSARPQQVENGVGKEHSLSKSAPPRWPSNQYQHQTQDLSRCAPQAPSVDHQNLIQQCQQNVVPGPQSNIDRYSSHRRMPNELSLVPSSNNDPQKMDMRRQVENFASRRQNFGQSGPDSMHSSKNYMANHAQFTSSEVPPPHLHTARSFDNENMYMGCYHSIRKNVSSYPCSEHACCPSAPSIVPHSANHMHPVPSSMIQHDALHPQVSYDDLYKIVLAQNDQLKALQAQVERLLLSQDHKTTRKMCCEANESGKPPMAVFDSDNKVVAEEGTQTSDCEARENDCQKMSIGVMTSFIHAVTYRGRVERLDAVHNVSEHESMSSVGNHTKQSKSTSSGDCSSSSFSPPPKSPPSQKNSGCTNCCKDCSTQKRHSERPKKHTTKKDKFKSNQNETHKQVANTNGNASCPESSNCNNPGVSAAITAVRGCQAVLASKAGGIAHDFSTFNGADLPTVTEQPVSPMSSIHVDLHDYRSSSSEEESGSSESDQDDISEDEPNSPAKNWESDSKPKGWTFYNNVLGQVNKILEERDMGGRNSDGNQDLEVQPHKQLDFSVSKRVAFEAQGVYDNPQDLKEMALKYLKENHPEELASRVTSKKTRKPHGEKLHEMAVYNMPASNMSFATFRYLERYNLLPENFNPQQYLEASANVHGLNSSEPHHSPLLNRGSKKLSKVPSGKSKAKCHFPSMPSNEGHYQLQPISNGKPKACMNSPPVHHASPRKQPQRNTPTSKILDITTLRQQPKLL